MAYRDIKKNKAYVARNSGWSVDDVINTVVQWTRNTWGNTQSPTWWTVNWSWITAISAESFDRETGINTWSWVTTFQNWKVISQWTPYSNPYTTTISKSSPYNNAWAWYKSNVSKNWWITVKKDLWYDLTDFGDVNTLGNKYKWQGYSIPTFWENIDFTKVPQLWEAGQWFDRFGKQAELMEAQTPWFLNKRNDAYLAELARTNPDFNTLDEASQKQAISELLQQRDVKGELFSWSKWQQDVLNTINSIYNRIWQWKTQNQIMNEKATQLYDTEQGNIDSMYQAEKNNFLKAGAVEDRFTNFNEVESKIQNTLLAAGQHRADNLYTGTPNDAQIAEIAQWLWQDFATTKKILEGRGYEDLQLQDEFNKEASQGYDRNMQDLEVNKQRAEEDADLQHQRTQAVLDQQIDDTKLQMQQDLAMGEKAGALSGAVRSSWYMQWLDSIKGQYMKNIGRLQERQARDTADTVQNKKRISEVYELNATRNKEDLNSTLKSIKMKAGLEMSQYLNEYAPSSTELERKLNDITNKYGILSQDAFAKYRENIQWITDVMTYDTEKIMELQQKKQTLQQVTVWNLLADNGMALAGLSKNDLQSMVQNGTISNADYSAMTGYMQSLGIATLQSKGVPTQEDISLYTSLLDSWVSPQQAITTVMSRSPSRYSWANAKDQFMTVWSGSQVFDTTTGQFVSAPWSTGGTQASYTWPTIPPATPEKLNASYSKYMNIPDGSKVRNGRCGEFVNDYIKEATGIWNNMFVDPINIRETQTNSSTPSVWSVVVMKSSWSPEATKYGHVAIVQSVNNDGTITIKEQNGANKMAVGTRKIPSANDNIVWYFDPQLWLQSWGGQTSQVDSRYTNTLYSTILWSKKTWPQQNTFKEWLSWLQWDDEATQRYLEQQYVDTLPTDTKKTLEMFDSTSSQAESALDILYWAKVQWWELNNSIWSKIWRKADDLTAFFWWDLEQSTKQYRQLRASIDASQADYRNALFGASLTPWEKASADTFIVDKDDTIDTVIAKLEWQNKTANIMRSNLIKKKLWLPVEKMINPFANSNMQPTNNLINLWNELANQNKVTTNNTTTQPTTNKNTTITTLYNMYWL